MSLDKTNKQGDQSLNKAFDNWGTNSPADSLWNKLNNSLDSEFAKNHAPSENEKSLKEAFSDWDAEAPNETLWSKLDANLSTEAVWNKLDESLDSAKNQEAWLKAAYSNWSTGTNHDGWNKLDDALSRERVWSRLNTTLSKPIALSSAWLKYAASLITFFFLSFFMNDESRDLRLISSIDSTTDEQFKDEQVNEPRTIPLQNKNNAAPTFLVNNEQLLIENPSDINSNKVEVQNGNLAETKNVYTEDQTIETPFDLSDLGKKPVDFACHDDIIRLMHPKAHYANWTASLGTQLSLLDESMRDQISTVTPRLGLAGELAFNKHFNHWGITQSVGYSQFSQTNGNYVNGRYLNSQQQLKVLQFNTTLFYSHNKFDFNGGLVFTRLLNGDEQQNNKIVNVYYMTNSIQAGLTGGVTYNISPASNRLKFGIGAQYQWIPQISAGNSTFNDIQGFKLSGKISF